MATIRELTARLNFKFERRGFDRMQSATSKAAASLKQLGGLLVGGLVVRGLTNFISSIIKAGDEVDKTSKSIGINREAFQEWAFAASLSGVESQAFALSLRKLQKNAVDAADGSKEMADDFRKLGVSVKDSNGEFKSAEQLLGEVADGMQALTTDTERVGIAQNILGRQGPKLLTLFANGAEGMAAMRAEARELGGVFEEDFLDASVELVDNITRFNFAMLGVKNTIARILLPVIDATVNTMTTWVKAWIRLDRQTNISKALLLVFAAAAIAVGIKLTIAFAGPILIFLKFALVIGIVVLIIEDLITLFEGGESAIGKFIDAIFGPGSATAAVEALKEAGKGLLFVYEEQIAPGMEAVGAGLEQIFAKIGVAWDLEMERTKDALGLLADTFALVWADITKGFDRLTANFKVGLDVIGNAITTVRKTLGIGASDSPEPPSAPAGGTTFANVRPRGGVPRRAAGAGRGRSGSVPRRRGGGGGTVNSDVRITINANTSGTPEQIGAAVRREVDGALRQQNREALEAVSSEVE